MKKLAFLIYLLALVIATPTSVSADRNYFKERGELIKIDIVRIILECKNDFPNNKPLFKKCFAINFLDARKRLKSAQKKANEQCELSKNQKKCVQKKIKEIALSDNTIDPVSVPGMANFVKIKCPMATFRYADMECGYVKVPENRNKDGSQEIAIAVLILKPHNFDKTGSTNPPLFYLHGGPGSGILNDNQFFSLQDWLLDSRKMIFFDQRGTGYSKPNLNCYAEGLSTNLYHTTNEIRDSLKNCYKRWSKDHDLTSYTTYESAADVEDIRKALGYEKINIIAQSYGTKLATNVALRFPNSINAMILDGVVAGNHDASHLYFQNALDEYFQACEENYKCKKEYPNLKERLLGHFKKYHENPIIVEGINPYTDEVREVTFDDRQIFGILYDSLLDQNYHSFHWLMDRLDNIGDRTKRLLKDIAEKGPSSKTSEIMGLAHYAVRCNEEVRYWNKDEIEQDILDTLEEPFQKFFLDITETYFDVCSNWDFDESKKEEILNGKSSIPVLMLSGKRDFLTPPDEIGPIQKIFTNSTHVIYPFASHGTIFSERCSKAMILDFLNNPENEISTYCRDDELDKMKRKLKYFDY